MLREQAYGGVWEACWGRSGRFSFYKSSATRQQISRFWTERKGVTPYDRQWRGGATNVTPLTRWEKTNFRTFQVQPPSSGKGQDLCEKYKSSTLLISSHQKSSCLQQPCLNIAPQNLTSQSHLAISPHNLTSRSRLTISPCDLASQSHLTIRSPRPTATHLTGISLHKTSSS